MFQTFVEYMKSWLRTKFEKYQIIDRPEQWSSDYLSNRDKFLTELSGSPVSSSARWKFYLLRIERRCRYIEAEHQPFKKLSGEELVTLQALHSTIVSLKASDVSRLFTKTGLISKTSALTSASLGTSRTWVEALLQRGVLKELTDPAITADRRKKYLYASANTRVEFYKGCIYEMLSHIIGVQGLFGRNSVQMQRELDLFAGYQILTKEEIIQFLEERKK